MGSHPGHQGCSHLLYPLQTRSPLLIYLFNELLFGPTLSQPLPSAEDPIVGKTRLFPPTHPHAQEAIPHLPPTPWHPSMALTTPPITAPKDQFWILLLRTWLLLNSSSLCPPPQDRFLGPMPSWDPSSFRIPDLIQQQPWKAESTRAGMLRLS